MLGSLAPGNGMESGRETMPVFQISLGTQGGGSDFTTKPWGMWIWAGGDRCELRKKKEKQVEEEEE